MSSGFYDTVEIAASGLSAERLAMDVIANNIANANTTRTPQGGAFKRQLVVFAQKANAPDSAEESSAGFDSFSFGSSFPADTASTKASTEGVSAVGIVQDQSPDRMVFDPSNPEADARGYVHYPNVQVVKEMVDLMAASRAYEADVSVIQASRSAASGTTGLLSS